LGNPWRAVLTGGERHDITQTQTLLQGLACDFVLADRGYDADAFLTCILQAHAIPVIPPRASRKQPRQYDTWRYRERHLVECCLNKIKHFRRVFSRFDKLAVRFLGFVHFAAVLIWLR
jgi:transposase